MNAQFIHKAEGWDREVVGADTTILPVPEQFWVKVDPDGPPALAVRALSRFLKGLAERQAADLGEVLHHADFIVTSDQAEVAARGSLHDCEECRAGVQRALRMMREDPDCQMIVGALFWAER